ncbi:uncharacterized protein SETTUDRAFT_157852 [Exserohilum turcica Et28A]|uniref:Uncharacterized protein n=1 Tax=Exserohilum turcicum (strain 28A) TaxID=671987 RepID=R0JX80_EXST2|nr:uncharacterized protein SETTUDRAFT_157852 [Exserohilum turcica Et28A]EOA80877.1 hypothetical protein SETTUDRAFT_157852 [Exserohilum turcica Et28A]
MDVWGDFWVRAFPMALSWPRFSPNPLLPRDSSHGRIMLRSARYGGPPSWHETGLLLVRRPSAQQRIAMLQSAM